MPSMPALARHDDVHQHDVGLARARLEDAPRTSPASPTVSMSVLGIEQQPQAGADDGVVVDDEHADSLTQRHLDRERRARPRRRLDPQAAAERARRARACPTARSRRRGPARVEARCRRPRSRQPPLVPARQRGC